MQTITEVVDKLESLGTSEYIALFLQDQRIKAKRSSPFECAIAAHATAETGLDVVMVNQRYISGYADGGEFFEVSIVGGPVSDFVYDFDCGKYPELVADAD